MKPQISRVVLLVVAVVCVLIVVVSSVRAAEPRVTVSHAINFQTGSRTIFCGITNHVPGTATDPGTGAAHNGDFPGLQCGAAGIGPPHPREGDPFVQLGQGSAGRARLVEIGDDDLVSDRAPATLAAGSTWSRDGLSCSVTQASVSCANRSGHGFTLAKDHLKTH